MSKPQLAIIVLSVLLAALGPAAEPVSVRSDRPGPLLAEYLAEGGLPERIVYGGLGATLKIAVADGLRAAGVRQWTAWRAS
jgi:hypothetical protein